MQDNFHTRMVVLVLFLLLIPAILLLSPTYSFPKTQIDQESSLQEAVSYKIKLLDGKVSLFKNDVSVKNYEIDPKLLPGEDQKLLSDGITVYSIEEADRLAEDFDG